MLDDLLLVVVGLGGKTRAMRKVRMAGATRETRARVVVVTVSLAR